MSKIWGDDGKVREQEINQTETDAERSFTCVGIGARK
jgi:hypothetical protein